jgi:hypothetical protein
MLIEVLGVKQTFLGFVNVVVKSRGPLLLVLRVSNQVPLLWYLAKNLARIYRGGVLSHAEQRGVRAVENV